MKVLPPSGPQRQRQLLMLGGSVVVLAFVLWRFVSPVAPAGPPSGSPNPAQGAQGSTTAASIPVPEPVKIATLEPVAEEPAAGRNLFQFGVRPPPPKPKEPPKPVVVEPPPGPPPPPPGPPPIRLQLLGLWQMPDGKRVASMKDPGSGSAFLAVEGQIVEGRYRIVKIGLQSVVVSYTDGSGQRTVGLGSG